MRESAVRRIALALFISAGFITGAWAQGWSSRPVRVIFPASPGSLLDTYLRAVTQQVAEATGQSMIVEDRPGASAVIGMQACAKSPPDGSVVCSVIPDEIGRAHV